jgi:GNAT superfamily N-acetyltransferase
MEQEKLTLNKHYGKEYGKHFEYEQALELSMQSGEGLVKFKDNLAELRQTSFGGEAQAHQEWLESYFESNHFGFLYTSREKVISALLAHSVAPEWLPFNLREYLQAYSPEAPDTPILWGSTIMTHPDYRQTGLASRLLTEFSEYSESYYRLAGAFMAVKIRQQNFASELLFTSAGFKPTGLFDLKNIGSNNFTNFQFWMKIIPPLYSKEAETFLSPEKRRQLQDSTEPYYLS